MKHNNASGGFEGMAKEKKHIVLAVGDIPNDIQEAMEARCGRTQMVSVTPPIILVFLPPDAQIVEDEDRLFIWFGDNKYSVEYIRELSITECSIENL
jgi:hypothetical protein